MQGRIKLTKIWISSFYLSITSFNELAVTVDWVLHDTFDFRCPTFQWNVETGDFYIARCRKEKLNKTGNSFSRWVWTTWTKRKNQTNCKWTILSMNILKQKGKISSNKNELSSSDSGDLKSHFWCTDWTILFLYSIFL